MNGHRICHGRKPPSKYIFGSKFRHAKYSSLVHNSTLSLVNQFIELGMPYPSKITRKTETLLKSFKILKYIIKYIIMFIGLTVKTSQGHALVI